MHRWQSYILVGYLAATLGLPAGVWHVHDDDGHHDGPAESCSYCHVVKTISVAIDAAPPTYVTGDLNWTQVCESEEATHNVSLPCTQPRAPPHTS